MRESTYASGEVKGHIHHRKPCSHLNKLACLVRSKISSLDMHRVKDSVSLARREFLLQWRDSIPSPSDC